MQGALNKMHTQLGEVVQYHLDLGGEHVSLNSLIGHTIKLRYLGQISCVSCQRSIKKSFNQGYCYPCFSTLAQCDMCIMKPETCHYEAGTCREPKWGKSFCFQPHIVYLANSSGIKVGITRETQTPTRWMDQGAVQALPIFKVHSRLQSGLIEVAFAKHVSDKTSWQQMLKSRAPSTDLHAKRDELMTLCRADLLDIVERFSLAELTFLADAETIEINYPVEHYPTKIKSYNLDKEPIVTGVLLGVKGQYLLLDTGVINIRKFSGYQIELSA